VAVKAMLEQLGSMRFADDENNLAQILFLPTPISIGVSAESLRIIQHNNHGWPVEGCALIHTRRQKLLVHLNSNSSKGS
jgi:hypothetical protein